MADKPVKVDFELWKALEAPARLVFGPTINVRVIGGKHHETGKEVQLACLYIGEDVPNDESTKWYDARKLTELLCDPGWKPYAGIGEAVQAKLDVFGDHAEDLLVFKGTGENIFTLERTVVGRIDYPSVPERAIDFAEHENPHAKVEP